MAGLTHFAKDGAAHMVDIGDKPVTVRRAVAAGRVLMQNATLALIRSGSASKGDVLGVARLAGIMGAKRTADLIPLCHPMGLDHVEIDMILEDDPAAVRIIARCGVTARTGVEMEALTAVTVAALTVYDMCKSVDRMMHIDDIHLLEKSGGRSGHFRAAD